MNLLREVNECDRPISASPKRSLIHSGRGRNENSHCVKAIAAKKVRLRLVGVLADDLRSRHPNAALHTNADFAYAFSHADEKKSGKKGDKQRGTFFPGEDDHFLLKCREKWCPS
jgi:hypothetical protein